LDEIEHRFMEVNGVKLHVAKAGPKNGELVILLHGFPEYWKGWQKQIAGLANKGYRVWAPDQRGYNISDKPKNKSEYRIDQLAEDIKELILVSGREKVILVGHDWGGLVSWYVGRKFPSLIKRLIILNAPHEAAMKKEIQQHLSQVLKSSYIGFFQFPWLPERTAGLFNWRVLSSLLTSSSREGTFSKEDLIEYRNAWSHPQAIRSMINWYRANLFHMELASLSNMVSVSTLLIWGARDRFLNRELALKSLDFCEEGCVVFFENSTHWVHLEESGRINQLITKFATDPFYLKNKLVSLS